MEVQEKVAAKLPAWSEESSHAQDLFTSQAHEKFQALLPSWRERVSRLVKEYGSARVGEVTIAQLYGGGRGIPLFVTDTSEVDPAGGVIIRGYPIRKLLPMLPRLEGTSFPLAGGVFFLLLFGEMPRKEDALMIESEWKRRSEVPAYVFDLIKALPESTHPMTVFSQAVLAMQNESCFARLYGNGLQKADYWKATLEDALNLTARVPEIAAYIYNLKYRGGKHISPDERLDWCANFAHMIGRDDAGYQELSRLYFFLHSDQSGGNVSAHAAHLVGSALSDIYYACSAGLNGLAGPLHGLANQECLRWLLQVRAEFGGLPGREDLERYTWDTIQAGKVIPGYGHSVLRETDPRFSAQLEFGRQYMPDDELFKLVDLVFEVVPSVLKQVAKIKNPWPNVDAISGTLQYHYGVRQFDFYTVLFGVGRLLGLTSQAVWSRALGEPIERPLTLTTAMLEEQVESR